jgi:hypothetical protein
MSALSLPQENVLLKYLDSKMIQKKFQLVKESISTNLPPTD